MSDVYRPQGPLTLDTVRRQLGALDGLSSQGEVVVDLSGVTEADSSAVALLLAWTRNVAAGGRMLKLVSVPNGLQRLIAVYGLAELLPQAE
ncbi:MAG: NTP-binding protein [Proteobacteria bacterium]|nr:NTP-binding protein [Pseudomonadota bacterium]